MTDRRESLLVFALALAFQVATAALAAQSAGIPLAHLGVYFDGHLYIEIAKSFPLPYAPEGRHYLGHAPGYPALIALLRQLTPASWVDWGLAALLASWIPAALSASAFHALCRAAGCAPLWPTLLFVVANPRWLLIGRDGPRRAARHALSRCSPASPASRDGSPGASARSRWRRWRASRPCWWAPRWPGASS